MVGKGGKRRENKSTISLGWGGGGIRGDMFVSKTAFIVMMNGFEQRGLTEDLEFCDGGTDSGEAPAPGAVQHVR